MRSELGLKCAAIFVPQLLRCFQRVACCSIAETDKTTLLLTPSHAQLEKMANSDAAYIQPKCVYSLYSIMIMRISGYVPHAFVISQLIKSVLQHSVFQHTTAFFFFLFWGLHCSKSSMSLIPSPHFAMHQNTTFMIFGFLNESICFIKMWNQICRF